MPWAGENDGRSGRLAYEYIEGKKVLIEQAIDDAAEALPLAQTASVDATNAVTVAGDADGKAVTALEKSTTAETNSTQAKTDSASALTKSTNAESNATSANTKSIDALSRIMDAVSVANTANNTSATALSMSNTALDTANLAKSRADSIIASSGTSSTEIVDSRLGADLVARATSGTLIREIHANQLETARQTTTLANGVAVVSGGVDALAETEIEGRTLISLANSNLEATKQYVVADKKTKVLVDGVTQSGVAKFTKGTTTVSTANFVGKVAGSTVANPHVAKTNQSAMSLQTPIGAWSEYTQGRYDVARTLDNATALATTSTSGGIAQQLFSFDIIAEIERKLGIIPKSTLAEKVQWVKDNVESLVANWHGFGSSVGGNKASLAPWNATDVMWVSATTHTNGTVTKIARSMDFVAFVSNKNHIDSNGFVHYLAYADASDGVTASSISTDYIDLVVTLKATAQLNTRPTIIRVENFEGKVSGSVVENPHTAKANHAKTNTDLLPPSSTTFAEVVNSISGLAKLDSNLSLATTTVNGSIAQTLFSFNLIEAVERNVGKIPRTSVADKVQWLKDNVNELRASWYGFGSSVGGNNASLRMWRSDTNNWNTTVFTHSSSSIAKLLYATNSVPLYIDANGFVHLLSSADASDGVTASTINTDFIDFEFRLSPTADFTRPKVALYEVTADSYAKILVDWSADEVVNRYPIVEGVQHLQGVGVIAEGENLLPPFTEWTLHANAKVISPYELELNATGASQSTSYTVNCMPNTTYTIRFEGTGLIQLGHMNADGTNNIVVVQDVTARIVTFTTGSQTARIWINFRSQIAGKFTFTNPMLTLGNVAKPFVPRNPSYLYADVKLGAIGTVADRLYEQDGAKFVRKVIEKDVVLGGDLAWLVSDKAGFKEAYFIRFSDMGGSSNAQPSANTLNKYDGKRLSNISSAGNVVTNDQFSFASTSFSVTISDMDTGFGETFVPSVAEVKAYFFGYKMNNGVFGTNYDGTGTKTWIPISDTTNARAVTVVPTSASPTQLDGTIQPYKLSYVLATPQVINVTDKVEGSLKVNGLTQVEALSGIVRREKVIANLTSGIYRFNHKTINSGGIAVFKNKAIKVLAVYEGLTNVTNKWSVDSNTANSASSTFSLYTSESNVDVSKELYITYTADKPLLTANPTNIKLLYANNMRSSLEDAVGKVQDNTTQLSVHEKAIIDLYVRVKALGG